MDNALLLNLSNQMVARRTMDVIANNIANMNTTGFKRETAVFQEHLVRVDVQGEIGRRKEPLSFVRDVMTVRDLAPGSLTPTGNQFDMAIEGDGYFVVGAPQGERYTRNGTFALDETGRLVTTQGFPVLDEGGAEIVFSPEETEISVARDGTISTIEGLRSRIQVVSFDNPQMLEPEGAALYVAKEPPVLRDGLGVVQGMVEQSNVQPVVEMTRMIETMRSYQASTELMRASDDLARRAVQKLGESRA